jgi:hypothetical protein
MRGLAGRPRWLSAGLLLAAAMAPASPAVAQCAAVPVYPGSRLPTSPDAPPPGAIASAGPTFLAADEQLLRIQQFYYNRPPSEGWQPIEPLPGMHPQHFPGYTPHSSMPEPVLEYMQGDTFVRIVGQPGGYTIILECR